MRIALTKDLVSEPGNILHPDEYTKRILQLKKIGLKITVFDQKKLKNIGMNALLGVGQGSVRGILSCYYGMERIKIQQKTYRICWQRCLF